MKAGSSVSLWGRKQKWHWSIHTTDATNFYPLIDSSRGMFSNGLHEAFIEMDYLYTVEVFFRFAVQMYLHYSRRSIRI